MSASAASASASSGALIAAATSEAALLLLLLPLLFLLVLPFSSALATGNSAEATAGLMFARGEEEEEVEEGEPAAPTTPPTPLVVECRAAKSAAACLRSSLGAESPKVMGELCSSETE